MADLPWPVHPISDFAWRLGDADIARITGVTRNTLNKLITERGIVPMNPRAGRGKARAWSVVTARRLTVIKALVDAGLSRRIASGISYALKKEEAVFFTPERNFPNREYGNCYVHIADSEFVFQTINNGDGARDELIGRIVKDRFEPSWDWRKELYYATAVDDAGKTIQLSWPRVVTPHCNESHAVTSLATGAGALSTEEADRLVKKHKVVALVADSDPSIRIVCAPACHEKIMLSDPAVDPLAGLDDRGRVRMQNKIMFAKANFGRRLTVNLNRAIYESYVEFAKWQEGFRA